MNVSLERSQKHGTGEEKVTLPTTKDFTVAAAEILYVGLESPVQERILRKKNKQTYMKTFYEFVNWSILRNSSGQISDACGKT